MREKEIERELDGETANSGRMEESKRQVVGNSKIQKMKKLYQRKRGIKKDRYVERERDRPWPTSKQSLSEKPFFPCPPISISEDCLMSMGEHIDTHQHHHHPPLHAFNSKHCTCNIL